MIVVKHLAIGEDDVWPVEVLCGKVFEKHKRIKLPLYCHKCVNIVLEMWNQDGRGNNTVIDLSEARERILRRKKKE